MWSGGKNLWSKRTVPRGIVLVEILEKAIQYLSFLTRKVLQCTSLHRVAQGHNSVRLLLKELFFEENHRGLQWSTETVNQWLKVHRDLCMQDAVDIYNTMGGEGHIAEIDKS